MGLLRTRAVTNISITGNRGVAAANTAVTVTKAAVAGKRNVIKGVCVSYSEAPTGGKLTIKDGASDVIFECDIIAGGPVVIPGTWKGSIATAMSVVLAAGGGTAVGKVNILETWTE
jgi:hypothetical protein